MSSRVRPYGEKPQIPSVTRTFRCPYPGHFWDVSWEKMSCSMSSGFDEDKTGYFQLSNVQDNHLGDIQSKVTWQKYHHTLRSQGYLLKNWIKFWVFNSIKRRVLIGCNMQRCLHTRWFIYIQIDTNNNFFNIIDLPW